ncbi:MAG: C4-type zinc ribbon domain-containing protein [Acidobacteriota bacterium]
MNADLEHLIALQRLDSTALDASRRLAGEADLEKAFDARLQLARDGVATAKQLLSANQEARRAIEKEVAVHQGRLSKFKEQAMAVKTNQEYAAVQKEITYAQSEIKTLEEKVLERMLEADELTAQAKRADAELAREQKAVDADRKQLLTAHADLTSLLEGLVSQRAVIVAALDQRVLRIFQGVAQRRNGVAVAEARDGICTICHVRLRPQVFNNVLRSTEIVQCDSCQRILYAMPKAPATAPGVPQSAQ